MNLCLLNFIFEFFGNMLGLRISHMTESTYCIELYCSGKLIYPFSEVEWYNIVLQKKFTLGQKENSDCFLTEPLRMSQIPTNQHIQPAIHLTHSRPLSRISMLRRCGSVFGLRCHPLSIFWVYLFSMMDSGSPNKCLVIVMAQFLKEDQSKQLQLQISSIQSQLPAELFIKQILWSRWGCPHLFFKFFDQSFMGTVLNVFEKWWYIALMTPQLAVSFKHSSKVVEKLG